MPGHRHDGAHPYGDADPDLHRLPHAHRDRWPADHDPHSRFVRHSYTRHGHEHNDPHFYTYGSARQYGDCDLYRHAYRDRRLDLDADRHTEHTGYLHLDPQQYVNCYQWLQ